MFDWIFVTAWRNIVWSLKITLRLMRGGASLISRVLNRRNNQP